MNPLIKIINIVALMIVPLLGAWGPKTVAGPAVQPAMTPPAAVAMAPAGAPAMVIVMRKIYFETGKVEVPAEASTDIAAIVAAAKDKPAARVVISGFHDATGNAQQNEDIAKQRALNVRDAIKAAGVTDDRFDLQKPAVTEGSGDNKEARRVEVSVK